MFYYHIKYTYKSKKSIYVLKADCVIYAIKKWLLEFNDEYQFVGNVNTFMKFIFYKSHIYSDENFYEYNNFKGFSFECIKGSQINLVEMFYDPQIATQVIFDKLIRLTRRNISKKSVEFIVDIICQHRMDNDRKIIEEQELDDTIYEEYTVCTHVHKKAIEKGRYFNLADLIQIYDYEVDYFNSVFFGIDYICEEYKPFEEVINLDEIVNNYSIKGLNNQDDNKPNTAKIFRL